MFKKTFTFKLFFFHKIDQNFTNSQKFLFKTITGKRKTNCFYPGNVMSWTLKKKKKKKNIFISCSCEPLRLTTELSYYLATK